MEKSEKSVSEYIIAQLEQPVLVNTIDENGVKKKVNATDPRDGHELTAREAIATKLLQNALNGDIKAAQFIMETEKNERMFKMMQKSK